MKKLFSFEIELGDLWEFRSPIKSPDPKKGLFLIVSLCEDEGDNQGVLGYNLESNTTQHYKFGAPASSYSLISRATKKE